MTVVSPAASPSASSRRKISLEAADPEIANLKTTTKDSEFELDVEVARSEEHDGQTRSVSGDWSDTGRTQR